MAEKDKKENKSNGSNLVQLRFSDDTKEILTELADGNATIKECYITLDIQEQLKELNDERCYRDHFETMAGSLVEAFRVMKQVPTRIKAIQGQFLDNPKIYTLLGGLAVELRGK